MECVLCDSTTRGLLDTCAWFPPNFAPYAFPFADLALYPSIVINLNMSMTICWDPWVLEKSLSVVWGTPTRPHVPLVLAAWDVCWRYSKIPLPQNVSLYLLVGNALALKKAEMSDLVDPWYRLGCLHDLQACPKSWERTTNPVGKWVLGSQLSSQASNSLSFPIRQQSQFILVPHWNYKLLWTWTSGVGYIHFKF